MRQRLTMAMIGSRAGRMCGNPTAENAAVDADTTDNCGSPEEESAAAAPTEAIGWQQRGATSTDDRVSGCAHVGI